MDKNRIIVNALIVWVVAVVAYLLGSFIALDFNITGWHAIGRVVYVIIVAFVGIAVFTFPENK